MNVPVMNVSVREMNNCVAVLLARDCEHGPPCLAGECIHLCVLFVSGLLPHQDLCYLSGSL